MRRILPCGTFEMLPGDPLDEACFTYEGPPYSFVGEEGQGTYYPSQWDDASCLPSISLLCGDVIVLPPGTRITVGDKPDCGEEQAEKS